MSDERPKKRIEGRLTRAYRRVMRRYKKVPADHSPESQQCTADLWRITLHAHKLGWIDASPYFDQ